MSLNLSTTTDNDLALQGMFKMDSGGNVYARRDPFIYSDDIPKSNPVNHIFPFVSAVLTLGIFITSLVTAIFFKQKLNSGDHGASSHITSGAFATNLFWFNVVAAILSGIALLIFIIALITRFAGGSRNHHFAIEHARSYSSCQESGRGSVYCAFTSAGLRRAEIGIMFIVMIYILILSCVNLGYTITHRTQESRGTLGNDTSFYVAGIIAANGITLVSTLGVIGYYIFAINRSPLTSLKHQSENDINLLSSNILNNFTICVSCIVFLFFMSIHLLFK